MKPGAHANIAANEQSCCIDKIVRCCLPGLSHGPTATAAATKIANNHALIMINDVSVLRLPGYLPL